MSSRSIYSKVCVCVGSTNTTSVIWLQKIFKKSLKSIFMNFKYHILAIPYSRINDAGQQITSDGIF